jgi:carbamate kinase
LLVALGGNAILRKGDDGSIATQYSRAREALADVAVLAAAGCSIVLTHGNGPVVGNIALRGEIASAEVPPMPLYIADADSEGGIGLLLQQALGNLLRERGCERPVVSVVTQVVVDASDDAFASPSKPIGPLYPEAQALELAAQRGWTMAPQSQGDWRRIVASPQPIRVVETEAISALIAAGVVTIAAGGGGVPVVVTRDGQLEGVDGVIDKDRTSALLATALDLDMLVILQEAEAVYRDWGTPSATAIPDLGAAEAMSLAASDDFAAGSMRPKLEACASFALATGRDALICASGALAAAVAGRAGTRITAG